MRICGITAEYDPFHNGHLYQLEETARAGADRIIAVISSSFTQRGDAGCMTKFRRAEAAAKGGADLVLELPAPYSLASAERFAEGAVSVLTAAGCDSISFGSESADLPALRRAAALAGDAGVLAETRRISETLGIPFPAARTQALSALDPDAAKLLARPNDLLAAEYIRACTRLQQQPELIAVPRKNVLHDSAGSSGGFASASQVRSLIASKTDYRDLVPDSTFRIIEEERSAGHLSLGLAAAERAVLFTLREKTKDAICAAPGCADGLGARLYNTLSEASSLEELYALTKTKRYTMTRVKRAVLCAALGIGSSLQEAPVPYLRVLAVGKHGRELLSDIASRSSLPVSQSLSALGKTSDTARAFCECEQAAYELYCMTMQSPAGRGENRPKIYVYDEVH